MNDLYDVILRRPLPLDVIRGLLFGTFALHMLFVLFTIGTAVLALAYFVRGGWGGREEETGWAGELLHTFLAHKSLAVVLGVAPLLLIQIGFTVPFFTAVSLLAPFWLMVIIFLIGAFLLFEFTGHNMHRRRTLRLVAGVLGLVLLLAVPGVFVAVLVTTENPDQWVAMVHGGYQMTASLAVHWLPRFLHVLGAGIVFGGVFHYLFSRQDQLNKRQSLRRWVIGGLLYQGVVGIALYLSLTRPADAITNISLAAGVLAAGALFWYTFRRPLALRPVALLLAAVLLGMLLTRQTLQDRAVLALEAELAPNAEERRIAALANSDTARAEYETALYTVHQRPHVIYYMSCGFCHGALADGKGTRAPELTIPPEVVSAVRTDRDYLKQRLLEGIPGSGMPYFTIYTGAQLDGLIDYLHDEYGVLGLPEPAPVETTEAARQAAGAEYAKTCAACHGDGGHADGPAATGLRPSPPDLTRYTLQPQYAFDIISGGYPGTAMTGYGALSEDLRWGLVEYVQGMYGGG